MSERTAAVPPAADAVAAADAAAGTLYIVATPIGNLEDITRRALRVLSEVDTIACEDTRHTRTLLNHFGIRTKTISYHEHNERTHGLVARIAEGANVALVSDAGTPAINDPGFRLVRACIERGINVVSVPGATAFVSALVASGLPTDEFYFAGSPSAVTRDAQVEALRAISHARLDEAQPASLLSSGRTRNFGEREAPSRVNSPSSTKRSRAGVSQI